MYSSLFNQLSIYLFYFFYLRLRYFFYFFGRFSLLLSNISIFSFHRSFPSYRMGVDKRVCFPSGVHVNPSLCPVIPGHQALPQPSRISHGQSETLLDKWTIPDRFCQAHDKEGRICTLSFISYNKSLKRYFVNKDRSFLYFSFFLCLF